MTKKQKLFNRVLKEYGYYIKFCTGRFHERCNYFLDFIFGKEDIVQMIYIHLWKYIGGYIPEKCSFKTYIVNNMKQTFNRVLYISQMQKRDPKVLDYLDYEFSNKSGDKLALKDTIADNSWNKRINVEMEDYFNKLILKEYYRKIYELLKQGYTEREIARKFNVTHQRIQQIARSIGKKLHKREKVCEWKSLLRR